MEKVDGMEDSCWSEDTDAGLGCLNVNVESVEGMGDSDWSSENVE